MNVPRAASTFAILAAVTLLSTAPASAELPSEVRAWMDESVKPCDNFYHHVGGNFQSPQQRVGERLDAMIESIVMDTSNEAGKLYASCMNTARIEALGMAPLWCELNKLKSITTHHELLAFAGKLTLEGTASFVDFDVDPDPKNATRNSLQLKMPDPPIPARVYKTADVNHDDISMIIGAYVAASLNATGEWDEKELNETTAHVVDLIHKFVPLYTDVKVAVRADNVDKLYPPLSFADASTKFPRLAGAFLGHIKPLIDDVPVFILSAKYFDEAEKIIAETDIEVLKAYVTFRIVHSKIDGLPEALRIANLQFSIPFNRELVRDRSAKCIEVVKTILPNTVGKLVLEAWRQEESIKMTDLILDSLLDLMEKRLHEVEWLTKETRERAIKKLKATAKLVGASDVTEAYNFDENEGFLSNLEHAKRSFAKGTLSLIDKPVDRFLWRYPGVEENAFHIASLNEVVIPVGFTQALMSNATNHHVRNFGGLGLVVGHEIIHGYDSIGRYYDENGSFRRWWSDADDSEFERRSKCFVDQYSAFELTDDQGEYVINNNGTTTLAENIADNGGLRLARQGYKAFARKNPHLFQSVELTDDEIEKLFFISVGQRFCGNADKYDIMDRVQHGTHSAAPARVNGMMMNSKEFSEVFECPVGSTMNPATKCEIW